MYRIKSNVHCDEINPVALNGSGSNLLQNYGAPTLTGAGWIFKFATEIPGNQ